MRGLSDIPLSPWRQGHLLPDPPAEELWCPIISADDHVIESPTLFLDRAPARLRDRVPKLVPDDEGVPYWTFEDVRFPIAISDCACGRPMEEWGDGGRGLYPQKFDAIRPGVYDPKARIADMDLNGVWASLCFPSLVWGFAGKTFAAMEDRELGLWCLRAYNDWIFEEWHGAYPDRLIPAQLPWLADPEIAAEEIRRNAERGFTAVNFSENPEGLGYPTVYQPYWEPFFAACEETETVINLHVGSSGNVQWPSSDSVRPVMTALFPMNGMMALFDWVFSLVPVRHPDIKVALSEGGVSWVPMALERLERAYRQRDATPGAWPVKEHPGEVALRNFWFTSIEDPSAFRLLDIIGVENVMIETDYPHMDSTWPNTQSMFRSELGHLDVETVKDVCYRNAARLYRHPEPPAEMLSRSIVGQAAAVAV